MYRILLIAFITLSIVGTIWYKFYSLNKTIKKQDVRIVDLVKDVTNGIITIRLKDQEIDGLTLTLDNQSSLIEKNSVDYNNAVSELEEWKNKPPVVKYKTINKIVEKYIKVAPSQQKCLEYLEDVSRINYEDL